MEVADHLSKSVQKTRLHHILEIEQQIQREEAARQKAFRDQQKAQREAYGRAVRENFPPKISEALRSEIEIRESRQRAKEEKIKAIRESNATHDYLREASLLVSRRQTNAVDESVNSFTNYPPVQ